MRDLDKQIKQLGREMSDIKIAIIKQEANYEKAIEILERLTGSVEYHIKRTDELQELNRLQELANIELAKKNELALAQLEATQKIDISVIKTELQAKKDSDNRIWKVLGLIGALILGLKELGILDKLL